jgi:hypothetical protein
VFEQAQLIKELRLLQGHVKQIDGAIQTIVEHSREGQILLSMQIIGVVQAAMILAAIGTIANFEKASQLKAYFGWAPQVDTSGISLDKTKHTHAGKRTMRQVMFLIVGNAIRMDCEWSRLYERLVPKKCHYDERTRTYKGKLKVIGRIAGQMIEMIFAFLKHDQEVLSQVPAGQEPPAPILYDPTIHQKHRKGEYQPLKKPLKRRKSIFLPTK